MSKNEKLLKQDRFKRPHHMMARERPLRNKRSLYMLVNFSFSVIHSFGTIATQR